MNDENLATDSSSPEHGLIKVVPLGHLEADVLRVVADGLQGVLRLPVDVAAQTSLPDGAFMESRQQYNAMAIIKHLDAHHSNDCLKVLGITSKDITNPILTYVFGEAYMNGSAAVVSYARLKTGPGTQRVSRETLLDRVVKVAIHEIGHTFDLPHCHTGRCVMRPSHSIPELEDKLNYLCDYCEIFLADAVTEALRQPSQDQTKAVKA